MIPFPWREKAPWMLVNKERLAKLIIVKDILKWSHLDESKNYIGGWSMMIHCGNESSSEKFQNDLIWINTKSRSDVGEPSNTGESDNTKRNSKMTSSRRRNKVHCTLVNDETLAKFILLREILKWSHFDQKKKYIGCWSTMKYWWNSSW